MFSRKVLVEEGRTRNVRIDSYLTIYEYFTQADSSASSIVGARLSGPHARRMNRRSAKLYVLTGGILDMVVDGAHYTLRRGAALLVEPGRWHAMHGRNARLYIICAPPFDVSDETVEG